MHNIHYSVKKLAFPILCLSASLAFSQTGSSVFPFMNLPVSARQAALGGDAVSIRDSDVNFAAVNPALMNLDMHNRVGINAAAYLADSKYGTLNYVRDFQQGHLVTVNARFMDFGTMPRTDEAGDVNGDFRAMDASVGAGYAFQFEEDWTIGANVNFITSKIDTYSSMAVAANVGVSYHLVKSKETVGLVLRNFGYQLKSFNGTREKMPFRIDLGYTKTLKEFPAALTVTVHDLQQPNISADYDSNGRETRITRKILDHFSFGAEIFPEKAFNIRLGYNIKRGGELAVVDQRSFAGLSAGFGVKFGRFTLDYAHVRYHSASNMNSLGVALDLNSRAE